MKKTIFNAIAGMLLIASSLVSAGIITGPEGAIKYKNNNLNIVSLQTWDFNLASSGVVTFDILAWGHDFGGFGQAHLDSYIWLFEDDGSLDWNNLITKNDDFIVGEDFNGSLPDPDSNGSSLDSFISIFINQGDYILMVGTCCSGQNDINLTTLTQHVLPGGAPETGGYRLDYSDNLVIKTVPAPATLTLIGLGLFGLGYIRKN